MRSRDADIRTVSHFVRRLRRVALHPLAADDPDILVNLARVQITFSRRPDGTMFMRSPLPDEVAFESLATRLRPFLVPSDDLYFEKAFKALERLIVVEKDNYKRIRAKVLDEWHKAVERGDNTRAYQVITEEEEISDVVLAYSWLYGDSIHGDHKKAETLDIAHRYRAAVGLFSGIAVVAIATSNMLRQFVELGVVNLPDEAFTDDVVVTETELRVEVAEAYHTDVGADLTETTQNLLRQTGEPLPHGVRSLDEFVDGLHAQVRDGAESDNGPKAG